MNKIKITPYDLAQRYIGIDEVSGPVANPQILAMLKLDSQWPKDDSVPWCSAFVNYIAWLLRLPRSKSLMARSWLKVGQPVGIDGARAGFDIVILSRGGGDQPGPDVFDAPGHVGFYSGRLYFSSECDVFILGGNQDNTVSIQSYPVSRLLGIRRLI
jgi:uncharacterized protein (TIGR02594 family)